MTVIAARVGHQDAQERHPYTRPGPEISDVERAQCSYIFGVLEPGRKPLAIVRSQGHQDIQLLLEIHGTPP
jgi:hypothetical protein